MAGDTDFIALYHELQLDSGCTLEDFKYAYRRRVAALHPDRETNQVGETQDLQRLNALYSAAMEFHRRHGRLPGAAQLGSISGSPAPLPVQPRHTSSTDVHASESRGGARIVLTMVVLAVIGVWASSSFSPAEDPANAAGTKAIASSPRIVPAAPKAGMIKLGITAQQVREIQGEPVSGWEQRWEYSPSWVAFRCGVVVDWYSSTLRPLKVTSEHPPATTEWSPPRNCKE